MNSIIAKRAVRMMLRQQRPTPVFLTDSSYRCGVLVRTLSAHPKEDDFLQSDLVKDCVKGIMDRRRKDSENQTDAMEIADERLEERFQEFQSLLGEARGCIADCKEESERGDLEEETKQANQAVDAVFGVYLDLVDELRSATPEQQANYSSLSGESASELKLLRQELDQILEDVPEKK